MPTSTLDPFDPQKWKQHAGVSVPGEAPGVIVGPMDALNVVKYRQRFESAGFQYGTPSPTDVFLFSTGTSPSRTQTKIGGLPYLFQQDQWPTDSNGNELPFVGQLDFRDSVDLVGPDTKGDLLLVFGELPSDASEPEVKLIWKDVAERPLVEAQDVPRAASFDEFYGTRWRTDNFPNAYSDSANDTFTDGSGRISYLSCVLFATQIGRAPFMLAHVPSPTDERVLCCLAPVFPAADGPFPFINEPGPLLEIRNGFDYCYDRKYKYVEQWLTCGDSTSLYIFVEENGGLRTEFILG